MPEITLLPPPIEPINLPICRQMNISLNILRLDKIHPLVSGNKWYKLKEYLKDADAKNKKTIITFGGAYSNHIHATAAICGAYGFRSVGIIRGEQPAVLSPTLTDAQNWNMELHFVSRADYKTKPIPDTIVQSYPDYYIINEGGYGEKGMIGAEDILAVPEKESYSYIIAAVGTGTTLAGLLAAKSPQQNIIGISVLKNNFDLEKDIQQLTGSDTAATILHDYHFGGYAKYTPELFSFMNNWYRQTHIPSDFVYTGKLFFAVPQLLQQNYFAPNDNILIVHSGGLQGNRSLPKGTLIF